MNVTVFNFRERYYDQGVAPIYIYIYVVLRLSKNINNIYQYLYKAEGHF